MSKRGGKRKNAGNKEGSVRPNFSAFWTQKEILAFMDWVKDNYKTDHRLAVWAGDHLFGKAPQPLTGEEGNPIQVIFERWKPNE